MVCGFSRNSRNNPQPSKKKKTSPLKEPVRRTGRAGRIVRLVKKSRPSKKSIDNLGKE